eukprot:Nk52_evm23s123 gene=Nk52_evmTU23s123
MLFCGVHNLLLVSGKSQEVHYLAEDILNIYPFINVEVFVVDLKKANAAYQLFNEVISKHHAVHLLVNIPSPTVVGNFVTDNPDLQEGILNDTVVNSTLLVRLLLPVMLKSGDSAIINVVSNCGLEPIPECALSSAANAFVLNFSRSLSLLYSERGLTVACVTGDFEEAHLELQSTEEEAVNEKEESGKSKSGKGHLSRTSSIRDDGTDSNVDRFLGKTALNAVLTHQQYTIVYNNPFVKVAMFFWSFVPSWCLRRVVAWSFPMRDVNASHF